MLCCKFKKLHIKILFFQISLIAVSNVNAQTLPNEVLVISDSAEFIKNVKAKHYDGVVSGTQILLNEYLDQPIDFEYLPFNRMNEKLSSNTSSACVAYRTKNKQREDKYLFSLPVGLLLNYKIYQLKTQQNLPENLLNSDAEVRSLSGLISALPNEQILVIDGISYGDFLDTQLALLPTKNLFKLNTSINHGKTSSLLAAKRTRFAIMFPGEALEYSKGDPSSVFTRYSIANTKASIKSYFMCNRHPASEKFLKSINPSIVKMIADPRFESLHVNYNVPQDAEQIKKLVRQMASELKF